MNTAMDEYELPKLIPMTGGRDETSAGSRSATPFGGAFEAMVVRSCFVSLLHVPGQIGPAREAEDRRGHSVRSESRLSCGGWETIT